MGRTEAHNKMKYIISLYSNINNIQYIIINILNSTENFLFYFYSYPS